MSQPESELVKLIHHPKVASGEWYTTYHSANFWQPFAEFPPEYDELLRLGLAPINPKPRWKPEAFRIASTHPTTYVSVIMHSEGAPPMTTPIFRRPSTILGKLFFHALKPHLMSHEDRQYGYKRKQRLNFPFRETTAPDQQPGDRPGINNVLTEPFKFYDRQSGKVMGDDPFRFELVMIGMPPEFLKWVRETLGQPIKNGFEFTIPPEFAPRRLKSVNEKIPRKQI